MRGVDLSRRKADWGNHFPRPPETLHPHCNTNFRISLVEHAKLLPSSFLNHKKLEKRLKFELLKGNVWSKADISSIYQKIQERSEL
jgi:hypothetical protein